MSRSIAVRLIGVVLLLASGLIGMAAWRASDASVSALHGRISARINEVSDLQLQLDVDLAAVRDLGFVALSSRSSEVPPDFLARRKAVQDTIDLIEQELGTIPIHDAGQARVAFEDIEDRVHLLWQRFDTRDNDASLRADWFDAVSNQIQRGRTWRRVVERNLPTGMDSAILIGFEVKDTLWLVAEHLARERGLIAGIIAANRTIHLDELQRLAEWRGVIKAARGKLPLLANQLGSRTADAVAKLEFAAFTGPYDLRLREVLAASDSLVPYPLDSAVWFAEASEAVDAARTASALASAETAQLLERRTHNSDRLMWLTLGMMLAAFIVAVAGLAIASLDVAWPLAQLTKSLHALAGGDHDAHVPGRRRRDEIGRIAAAAQVFKTHAIELAAARRAADADAKSKSDFLATMSHEIRTPMNGVLGMLDLIEDTELTDEQREMLEVATTSARSLLSIIDDILDFSKIAAGKLDIEAVETDLETTVFGVADMLAPRAWAKELELAIELDPALPRSVIADPVRLRQVLTNLVGNAIKFTERGHVLLRLREADEKLRFEVSDTGIGLEPPQIERLFRPFEQAEAGTTRRFGGTGLGLAICRRIVELMGGRIDVESRAGVGSTFWFELPLHPVEPRDATRRLAGLTVSLDAIEPVLREGLAAPLRAAGATIVQRDEEAIQIFERESDGGLGRSVVLLPRGMRAEGTDRARPSAPKPTRPSLLVAAVAAAAERAPPVARAYQIPAPQRAPESAPTPRAGARVLVAEDHPSNRIVIRKMLERLGLEPVLAEDGEVALGLLEKEPRFDLLLTDCHMPNVDGFELARRVRTDEAARGRPHLPIVALSASVLQEEIRRCAESGMDDFLAKPIDPRRLRATLARWIEAEDIAVATASEAMPAVSGPAVFDFSPYAELFEPDEARRIADDYARTTREQLDALAQAFEAGDFVAAGHSVHAVAGGALTIGAHQLGEIARSIENALRGGDLAAARAEMPRLEPSFAAVQEQIAQL
jgi:signal transduction histidine kinase/CheY-like chemotaxis protein/HPt (histidine-containing phosphotransfer) domain-containing protein